MTHEILVMSTNLILAMASVEGGTPFEFTRDDVALTAIEVEPTQEAE